jgi:hypothetical protein
MSPTEQISLGNWPTFQSYAPLAHALIVTRIEPDSSPATETMPHREKSMASRTNMEFAVPAYSTRLEGLLDKLVAVQMDLEPVCGVGAGRVPVVAAHDAIASACAILHSAIADVRSIIYQVDGLIDPADAASAQDH